MKNQIRILIIIFCLANTSLSVAQTKGVEDETIIVVKPYQATLSDAFKISENPMRDTTKYTIPDLKYYINPAKAETEYTVQEIKPVKIKDEAIPKLYRSYLKAGVGNYATRYGEFFFNSLRSKNFNAGIHLKHTSSQGKIKNVGSPFFSENFIKVYGDRFFSNSVLSGKLSFDRDVVNYYGYNIDIIDDTTFALLKRKQRFDYFDAEISFKNNTLKKDRFDYYAGINYYFLKDRFDIKENNFILNLSGGTNIDQFYMGTRAHIDATNQTDKYYDYTNNIFTIHPFASTTVEALDLEAGVKFSGVSQGHGTKFKIFPEINARFKLIDNYLIVFAAVTGRIQKNSYRNLTQENLFYQPDFVNMENPLLTIPNSMASNSEVTMDFTAGLKGTFTNTTSYHFWLNYSNVNAMPLFVNKFNDLVGNTFILNYDDVSIFNIHGELGYNKLEKIRFIAKADFFNYSMTAEEHPWHKPSTEITFTANYTLADKIIVKGEVFYVGKRFAKNMVDSEFNQLSPIELKGYMDLNLGVDYRYTKILSFFVNFNNIGAAKYQYWNNYPVQRFNILGGLTFAF